MGWKGFRNAGFAVTALLAMAASNVDSPEDQAIQQCMNRHGAAPSDKKEGFHIRDAEAIVDGYVENTKATSYFISREEELSVARPKVWDGGGLPYQSCDSKRLPSEIDIACKAARKCWYLVNKKFTP